MNKDDNPLVTYRISFSGLVYIFFFFRSSFHINALLMKKKEERNPIEKKKKALRLTFSSHLSIISLAITPELRIAMINRTNEGEKQVW
jgi:hypothetical protein